MEDSTKTSEIIGALAGEFIEKLGFEATVEVDLVSGSAEMYRVHIKTEDDAPMLIGKHARMLSALQRVIGAMMFKKLGTTVDILVDVNDYREGQRERLIGIANNVAQRVIDEGRPARLSAFSPYERRIIHEHINENYLSLKSYSEGEGEDRKLVVEGK